MTCGARLTPSDESVQNAKTEFRLKLPADLDSLAQAREFIATVFKSLGVDDTLGADLILGIDEAITNVMIHGYRGGPGAIRIEVAPHGSSVHIRLEDHAPLFNPTKAALPDLTLPLDQRPIGGMGIPLMRRTTDELLYRVSSDGGNELTMIKHHAVQKNPKP